jgi:glutamyl/glutaminyl-tRNA synthetase
MHTGHAWVAWHNYDVAAGSGGRFVLIVDDIMYYLQQLAIQSWPLMTGVDRYIEDLTWLGMPPSDVVFSTRNAEAHADAAARLGIRRPGHLTKRWWGTCVPNVTGTGASNQYDPWVVMTRVVDDYVAGVDAFYRGRDIEPEMYLYDDTCRRLGYRPCGQEYLPLIRREGQDKKESKSAGAVSIRDLRAAGYAPQQIISTLRECARRSKGACLCDVVLPADMLQTDQVKWLAYDTYDSDAALRANADAEPRPWSGVVRAYHSEMRRRERRAVNAQAER